jgi:aldose 1-epimerase
MQTDGVWLSGHDPIPTDLVTEFPQTWDYNEPSHLDGPLIDNCFTGWNGKATIRYPDRGLALHMHMLDCNGYTLLYRPPAQDYFCLEPITHPIDAFHMENKPGLALLKTNDSLALRTRFLVTSL